MSSSTKTSNASSLDPSIAARLKRNDDGLVAAIAQDAISGRVLMQAWMNDEALHLTLTTGRATYWSRSRQEIWVKGLTSGHTQRVLEVRLDCDGDSVLLQVEQVGGACHTGEATCFDGDVLMAPTLLPAAQQSGSGQTLGSSAGAVSGESA